MWWLSLLGVVLLLATAVDLAWTTLGTHGGGPLSGPLMNLAWTIARGSIRRHRLLSFVGSLVLVLLLVFWVTLAWAGWTLVFSGDRGAIINAHTQQPVATSERIFFVGTAMFTSGTSEYNPNGRAWHLAAAVCAGSGLFVITMAITYIMSVLTATVEKRALAAFVWDLGATPQRIIDRAWDGEKFSNLQTQLDRFVATIELFGEQNLAYPILQFYHSENRRTAEPLRIAALMDTLILMYDGVDASVRPPRLVLETAIDAIRGFALVVERELVDAAAEPPPPPALEILNRLGIPTRPKEEFLLRVNGYRDVRRRLLGLIEKAGWTWEDVFQVMPSRQKSSS